MAHGGTYEKPHNASFGDGRSDLVPPAEPPTRNQFNYALKHHPHANADTIARTIQRRSRRLAAEMGLGTADAPGSLSRPSQQRVAYGDVTILTTRTRRLPKDAREVDPDTGEILVRRHDPNAALHTTGGGNVVPGLPFTFTHLRGPQRNQQVVLAIDPIPPGGESKATSSSTNTSKPLRISQGWSGTPTTEPYEESTSTGSSKPATSA